MRSMMKTAPKGSKLRTELGMCAARIRVMSERKKAAAKTSRREVSQLLARGNDASARIQVEDAIRKDNTAMAYDMLEQYCQLLMKHAALLDGKECPPELKEAVATVVYAARLTGTDLPELSEVRSMVKSRFGKDFVASAESLRPQCGVNTRLHTLLSARSPPAEEKIAALKRIAAEHGVAWDASRFESDVRLALEPALGVSPQSAAAATQGGGGDGHANGAAGGCSAASAAPGVVAVGLQAEQLQQPSSQEQQQYERFQHLQHLQKQQQQKQQQLQQQQQQQQPQQADWLRGASGSELSQHAKTPPAAAAAPASSAAVTAPAPPPGAAGAAAAAPATPTADVYALAGAMRQQQQSLTPTPSQQGGQPNVQQLDQHLSTLGFTNEPVPASFDESDLELLPPPPPVHHMPAHQRNGAAYLLEGRSDSRRQQQQKEKQYQVHNVAVVATESSAADACSRGDAAGVPDDTLALEQQRQRQQQLEAIRKIGERARIAAMRPNPAAHTAQTATGAPPEAAAAAAHATRAVAGAAASNAAAMKMDSVVAGGREDHGSAKIGGRRGTDAVEGVEDERGDGFAGVGQWDSLPVSPAPSSAAAASAARFTARSSRMPQDSARQGRSSNECNDTTNSRRGGSDDEEASGQPRTVAAASVPASEELDGTLLPPPPPPPQLALRENADDLAPEVEGVDSRMQQPPASQPKHQGSGSPLRSPSMGWSGGHPALEDLKSRYERLVKDKPPARNW